MREQDRQHARGSGSRSRFESGYRAGDRDYEGPRYEENPGERERSYRTDDWPEREREPSGPRYASRGREEERLSGGYGEDRDRNIIDRVISEVRSWFNDTRDYGRGSYPRGRGGNYPDYGSDYARSYTGHGYGRDYGESETAGRYGEGTGPRTSGRSDQPLSSSESDWREERSPWTGGGYRPRSAFVYSEFWLVPGPHSGIGPKGYRRSTDRIREEVCERLEQHGRIDASDIEIDVQDDGEVRLTGTVDSREIKRMAEDVAESVFGVRDVQNQIRVRRGGPFERDREQRPGESDYQEGLTGSTARTEQAAQKGHH